MNCPSLCTVEQLGDGMRIGHPAATSWRLLAKCSFLRAACPIGGGVQSRLSGWFSSPALSRCSAASYHLILYYGFGWGQSFCCGRVQCRKARNRASKRGCGSGVRSEWACWCRLWATPSSGLRSLVSLHEGRTLPAFPHWYRWTWTAVLACESECALPHRSTAFRSDRILQRCSDLELCLHYFIQRYRYRLQNLLVCQICPSPNLRLKLMRGQCCLTFTVDLYQPWIPLSLTTWTVPTSQIPWAHFGTSRWCKRVASWNHRKLSPELWTAAYEVVLPSRTGQRKRHEVHRRCWMRPRANRNSWASSFDPALRRDSWYPLGFDLCQNSTRWHCNKLEQLREHSCPCQQITPLFHLQVR